MTDPWMIGSALAIAGPAVGFIVGRLTSGIVGLRQQQHDLERDYVALTKHAHRQAHRILGFVLADEKRRTDARRRDERYRARQAEKRAARYAKTHAELAGIVAEKAA